MSKQKESLNTTYRMEAVEANVGGDVPSPIHIKDAVLPLNTFGAKLVKQERFDPTVILQILKHDNIGADDKKRLQQYYKKRFNGNIVEVKYDFSKDYKSKGLARVYAEKGLGLQQFPCDIRNALGQAYYFDVDIKNAHPTILLRICKENGWSCPNLDQYVSNRDDMLADMSTRYNMTKGDVKMIMNTLMYLGGIPFTVNKDEFLMNYQAEMFAIASNIKNAYMDIFAHVSKKRLSERDKLSTTVSFVLSTEEHKILMAMNNYVELNGRNVDVLLYDGFWLRRLPKEKYVEEALLIKIEEHVKKETGYAIKLAEKPMSTSLVFTKTKDELEREAQAQEDGKAYLVKNYDYIKEQFESMRFKVKHPIVYCEQSSDGELIMRSERHMEQVYRNKYYLEKCQEIDPETKLPIAGVYFYKMLPFMERWLDDENIRTYERMDMFPPPMECPEGIFNLWNGFAVERMYAPSSGNIQPFIDHLKILVGHDANALDYMIKWLAFTFQQPGVLQGTAPVFRGEQGTGKGLLFEVWLPRMVGDDKYAVTRNPTQDLFSRFSNKKFRRFFVNIDETSAKDSIANSEVMKGDITSPKLNFEEKGLPSITVNNFVRYVFTTNNLNPVKIEGDDRRYFVMDTSSEKIGDKGYFDGFFEYINNDSNLKAIHAYLMDVDVSNVNWIKDRPETMAYNDIKTTFVDVVYKFLINITRVYNKTDPLVFTVDELFTVFSSWCQNNRHGKTEVNDTFTPVISKDKFSKRLNAMKAQDVNCGFEKKRKNTGFQYTFNVETLNAHLSKRNLLNLEFSFDHSPFMSKWLGHDSTDALEC